MNMPSITYLAAAVSDFYVPDHLMATHKIQSKGGSDNLLLDLSPVPKKLGDIKKDWNPKTILISFKLETDHQILEQKATGAM